jgi:uncharacterized protein DUF4249
MKKILLYAIALVTVGFGCETVIEIDIPVEPPSLVINSTLSDNDYIKAHISESKHILDGSDIYKTVQGATIEIYEEGNLLTTLPDSLEGNYISNTFKPVRGKMYEIIVAKTGFKTATAKVLIPLDTVEILSVKVDTIVENDFGYTSYYLRFSVEFEDDIAMDNYYDIAIYREGYAQRYDHSVDPPVYLDSIYFYQKRYIQSRDPSLEEFQSYGESILLNDELFNGNKVHINVLLRTWIDYENPNPEQIEYTYYVEIANTSYSYYQYELSSQLQYWTSDNPFAQPVTVYNNIENGFGVFGAYNTAVFKVE